MNSHPIKNGNASILMIEPQNSRRVLMSNAIKGMGYASIHSVPTIKDALALLETGSVQFDWIITGLYREATNNGMQLLGTCLAEESLRHIRVSLFLEADEQFCVSDAFSLGLFSYHHKHTSTNGMTDEIRELLDVGDACGWNDFDISAHYLRTHLKHTRMFESLVRMEREFLTNFPGNVNYVINYAEALIHTGNTGAAEQMLNKVNPPNTSAKNRINDLLHFIHQGGVDGSQTTPVSIKVRIKTCIIVDPDESSMNGVIEALELIGVEQIHKFSKGKDAAEFMKKNPEPDLIIQEWRISDFPGPGLIQFVRNRGFINTGIVVYSSLVKNADRPLVREIGITDVIEKPKSVKVLANTISSLVLHEYALSDVSQIESKIRMLLRAKDLKGAKELYQKLLTKSPPDRIKESLEAEFSYFEENFRDAIETAVRVLHSFGEEVSVLNLLGKIYMKQGQFNQALFYFNRANDLAPLNIERLCNLAVSHASVAETDFAEESLMTARSQSSDEYIIDETEVKLGLINGQVDRARNFMNGIRHSSDLIAFINNRGVWLSTQGRLPDGIQLYETALKALTENLKDIEPAICYNLALAHVKSGNTKDAFKYIQLNPDAPSPELAAKINSLNVRLSKAVEKGTKVTLNQAAARSPKLVKIQRLEELPWLEQNIQPGDARLFGIFIAGEPISPDVLKMFENMPRFGHRSGLSQNSEIKRSS